MKKCVGVAVAVTTLWGCQPHESPTSQQSVGSLLMGSLVKQGKRQVRDARPPDAVTLLNITGTADSLLVLTEEDFCGFSAWSANDQTGPIGRRGRTGESFDLAHPRTWTSHGTGLRPGCQGGTAKGAEAWFYFLDLSLDGDHDGQEDLSVRIFTSESSGARFGDLQLRDSDGVYKWIQEADHVLTTTRPETPVTYVMNDAHGPLEVPWFDQNGTVEMVMTRLPLRLASNAPAPQLTPLTRKLVFDVDFSRAGVTAADKSTPAAFATTLGVPFLTNLQNGAFPVEATVTALTAEQIDGPDDPAPGGLPIATTPDAGTPDAGP